jgi:hypothetical protein
MPQQTSPFLEGKWGWTYGESGWNDGMDENLLKFSFMLDRTVDSVVSSLPQPPTTGMSYFLTTDNRLYYVVSGVYYSSPTPKWSTVTVKSSGDSFIFDGTSLLNSPTNINLGGRVTNLETTVNSLGTAAFKDVSYFASTSDLATGISSANAYTDAFKSQLLSSSGTDLIHYGTRSLTARLGDIIRMDVLPELTANNPSVDNGPALNILLNSAATNRAVLDGFGATFYVRTPVQIQSNQILKNVTFKSMGSPDGAGVAKSHIPVVHINGVTTPKTNLYFENVTVDGSRALWPNISMSTPGPEGGGGEDGGMHAWRIAGVVSKSIWVGCKGISAGTAGFAIHTPLPSTTSVTYDHKDLIFINCEATNNREHGMFADSFKNIKWLGGKLTGNGLDLNTTDPLVHGNRGARDTNSDLFGMPFDLEAYGPNFLGSMFTDFLMQGTDCRGNAIMGTVYNPIASNLAGYVSSVNIRLVDCDLDSGTTILADRPPNTDGLALNVLGNLVTVYPFNGMVVSSRLSGRPSFNGVSKLDMSSGFIETTSPKAILNNCSYFDCSCPALVHNLQITPTIGVTATKTGGTPASTITLTLSSVRSSTAGVDFTYSVNINGALAADGPFTANLTPPSGYLIEDFNSGIITVGGVPIKSSSVINGTGTTGTIFVDTATSSNLVGTIRVRGISTV